MFYSRKAWDIRAYTYEADIHCVECAEARFTADALRTDTAEDREGNKVHPVFESDESPAWGETCGTCGEVIAEPWEDAE